MSYRKRMKHSRTEALLMLLIPMALVAIGFVLAVVVPNL